MAGVPSHIGITDCALPRLRLMALSMDEFKFTDFLNVYESSRRMHQLFSNYNKLASECQFSTRRNYFSPLSELQDIPVGAFNYVVNYFN